MIDNQDKTDKSIENCLKLDFNRAAKKETTRAFFNFSTIESDRKYVSRKLPVTPIYIEFFKRKPNCVACASSN